MPYKRGVKSKEAIPVCYYLPRHPNDWAEDCEENSAYQGDGSAISKNPSSAPAAPNRIAHSSFSIELSTFGEVNGATGVANQHSSSISVSRGVSPKLAGKARRWELIGDCNLRTEPLQLVAGARDRTKATVHLALIFWRRGVSNFSGVEPQGSGCLKHQVSWAGGSTPFAKLQLRTTIV